MTADTARPDRLPAPTGLRGVPEEAHLRVTLPRVIRSEWVKLSSLRSTWITAGVAVVVLVGFGAMAAGVAAGDVSRPDGGGGGRITALGPTGLSLAGADLAGMILGILGVLAVSSEYSSGMIRATLAAVPRRWPVLVAKTLVVGALSLVVAVPATLAAFFVGQAILGSGKNVALSDPGVLGAVLGTGVYVGATALLGLAIGALLRHSTGAVGALFVLLLLAPGLLGLILPSSWADTVLKYLPSNAASSFTSVTAPTGMLSPVAGGVVLALWVVAFLAGAEVLLRRRDA